MGMTADQIKTMIAAAIPGAAIELSDLAGDNEHYSVTVTSSLFAGKSRIEQHRMVMNALGGGMGTTLHALSVTTKTA
jgi:stress-induced morphogen